MYVLVPYVEHISPLCNLGQVYDLKPFVQSLTFFSHCFLQAAQLDSSLSSSVALPQPPALSQQPGSSDFVAVGQARPAGSALPLGAPRPGLTAPPPAPASAITCHLYHHFGNGTAPSSMSSTVPAAASGQTSAPAARSVLSTTAPATVPAATARSVGSHFIKCARCVLFRI